MVRGSRCCELCDFAKNSPSEAGLFMTPYDGLGRPVLGWVRISRIRQAGIKLLEKTPHVMYMA